MYSCPTRVVASVDVGKVNMAVCVARIRACRPESTYLADETSIEPPGPVLGDMFPSQRAIHRTYPAMDIEWEDVHYAARIVRWGVYSLRSNEQEAASEERTGRRYKPCAKQSSQRCAGAGAGAGVGELAPQAGQAVETLEMLIPALVVRAQEWLRIWSHLGVTDVCIEQQVAMGGGAPGCAMYGSMAGNVAAKVLSHVLQSMCVVHAERMKRPWAIHFMSPRLTNAIADHLRGDRRAAKGVSKHDKKKFAVQAVQRVVEKHNPPLSGVFMRATKSKRDDLSDCFLQAVRFVRDRDGVQLRKALKKASGRAQ